MNEPKGLTANVYRDEYRCSINLLNDAKTVTIIDQEVPGIFTPNEDAPAVKLVRRKIYGRDYIHAEPAQPGHYAFGGSFIYTSDSRMRELNTYPIPLHDRQMNLEGRAS